MFLLYYVYLGGGGLGLISVQYSNPSLPVNPSSVVARH